MIYRRVPLSSPPPLVRVWNLHLNPQSMRNFQTSMCHFNRANSLSESDRLSSCRNYSPTVKFVLVIIVRIWNCLIKKKKTYLDIAITKKKKKTVKQGGVRQVVCFELAGEHHDMNLVNRVNRMKFDCHFPSYVSRILLFKNLFPAKRVLI